MTNIKNIKDTVVDFVNKPYKTAARYKFSGLPFFSIKNKYDSDILELLLFFSDIGANQIYASNDESIALISEFREFVKQQFYHYSQNNQSQNDQAFNQALLNKLYELFYIFQKNGIAQRDPKMLKRLKQLIHRFAKNHDLIKKIINIEKIAVNQINHQVNPEQFITQYNYLDNKLKNSEIYVVLDDQKINEDIKRLNKNIADNQKIVFDSNTIKEIIDKLEHETFIRKVKASKTISWIKWFFEQYLKEISDWFAFVTSIAVGLGEGLAAAVLSNVLKWHFLLFFTACPHLIPIALFVIIFGAGFGINYVLFKPYCIETFREIFLGNFFKNEKGLIISPIKKILVTLGASLSFGGTIALGVLAYASAVQTFGMLIPAILGVIGISAACPPLAIAIVAAIIATFSAIALFASFQRTWKVFIAEDQLWQVISFLKKMLELPGYQQATLFDWSRHVIKCVSMLVFIVLGVAIASIAAFASSGLYHTVFVTKLQSMLHLSFKASTITSAVIVLGMATALNLIFQIKNDTEYMVGLHQEIADFIVSVKNWVIKFFNPTPTSNPSAKNPGIPLSKTTSIINTLQRFSLYVMAIINGIGQGKGMGTTMSMQLIKLIFFIPKKICGLSANLSSFLNSTATNINVASQEFAGSTKISHAQSTANSYASAWTKLSHLPKNGKDQNGYSYCPQHLKRLDKEIAQTQQNDFVADLRSAFAAP